VGIAKEVSQRRHLLPLADTARVLALDNCHRRGGYATIRRICIVGAPRIEEFWKFAAKRSNQSQAQPDLAKVEHQNKSMAVTIPHAGVL
jgi:hypothetical protein